jgi:hypothetical protein
MAVAEAGKPGQKPRARYSPPMSSPPSMNIQRPRRAEDLLKKKESQLTPSEPEIPEEEAKGTIQAETVESTERAVDGDVEEDDDFDEYDEFADDEEGAPEANNVGGSSVGFRTFLPAALVAKFEEMGDKVMDDPMVKQELHSFGWTIIDSIIPTFGLTLIVANFILIASLFKKDSPNIGWKILSNCFSLTQKMIIIGLDVLLGILFVLLIMLIAVGYCVTSGKFIWDNIRQVFGGEDTVCNSFGLLDLVRLYKSL